MFGNSQRTGKQMKQGWQYIHIDTSEVMMMSGWKFYVYGRTIEESNKLARLLQPVVQKYNLTAKVATNYVIERNKNKNIAWSAVVIYLKPKSFKHDLMALLVHDITGAVYKQGNGGVISGAKILTWQLWCRYDLTKPIDPYEGIVYDEYIKLYRGEDGAYNIKYNTDPFEDCNIQFNFSTNSWYLKLR
jgi:hypothetical protein